MSKFRDWVMNKYEGIDDPSFLVMKEMIEVPTFPDTDSLETMSEFLTDVFARVEFHEALAVMHYHFTFGTR